MPLMEFDPRHLGVPVIAAEERGRCVCREPHQRRSSPPEDAATTAATVVTFQIIRSLRLSPHPPPESARR